MLTKWGVKIGLSLMVISASFLLAALPVEGAPQWHKRCHGTGTIPCHICHGHAGETSGILCPECENTGKVQCPRCRGTGILFSFIEIQHV